MGPGRPAKETSQIFISRTPRRGDEPDVYFAGVGLPRDAPDCFFAAAGPILQEPLRNP